MEAGFYHIIKQKCNCDFLSHKSDFLSQKELGYIKSQLWG